MNKEQEKILTKAYEKASENAQNFIHDEKYVQIILDINKNYNLTEKESEAIQIRTLYILLNIEDEQTAKQEIILALRDRTSAEIERIVQDIEKNILIYK